MTSKVEALIQEAVQREISARARKAGLVGGPARANALTAKRRSEIARKASQARWRKARVR